MRGLARPAAALLLLAAACQDTEPLRELNSRPFANAGPDQVARIGEFVTLIGMGSDRDGDPLDYRWMILERPDESTAMPSAVDGPRTTIRIDRAGRYVVRLVVDDGRSASTPDDVVITTVNRPPTIDAGEDQRVDVGAAVQLQGFASDPDGDPMTFEWTVIQGPNFPTINAPNTLQPRFVASAPGLYALQLEVRTTPNATVRDSVRIRCGAENRPPIAEAGDDQSIAPGDVTTLDGSASRDPDGDPLSFTWSITERPTGSTATLERPDTATPELATDRPGTYVVRLVVSDGFVNGAPDDVRIVAVDGELPTRDILDPNEVYILGTVSEGLCGRDILTHWSQPNSGAVGFDCYTRESDAIIAPGRNRLLYWNTFEDLLREFVCDGRCTLEPSDRVPYPPNVLANDPVRPTPPCDPNNARLLDFHVWPDGQVIHHCANTWYDATGAAIQVLPRSVIALSHGGQALIPQGGGYAVATVATSSVAPVVGLPDQHAFIAARSRSPSGFWYALESGGVTSLWSIDATGASELVFGYAAPPAGYTAYNRGRLDGHQNLFQLGRGPETFEDVIVRRERDGPTTVVYTEASNPLVKLHISDIVTGP